jgi:hypothetical protein
MTERAKKAERCRHRRTWILGGAWLWCFECGALRKVAEMETWRVFVKPVGRGGKNPWKVGGR